MPEAGQKYENNSTGDNLPDSIYYPRYTAWSRMPPYIKMKRKLGHEGAGILAELTDYLCEQDQRCALLDSIPEIAYQLHADPDILQSIITDFDLFRIEDGVFWSPLLNAAMRPLDEKRKKQSEAGKRGNAKRWGNYSHTDQEAIASPSVPDSHTDQEAIASRVEYSRVKKSRVKGSKKENWEEEFINPFPEDFLPVWGAWKTYKLQEHRFRYKTVKTEQEAINDLFEISNKDPGTAREIIRKSMANGYKGLFSLNNQKNGTAQQNGRNSGSQKLGVSAAQIDALKDLRDSIFDGAEGEEN